MTNHNDLPMQHPERRVADPKLLLAMLKSSEYCTVAFHDEPFPYVVPMNGGFEWEEGKPLTVWLHMAVKGHRINLIRQNPCCTVNACIWLDRVGHKRFRKEPHDYRSVTVFGKAEIITADQPEEYLHGLGLLSEQHRRSKPVRITDDMKQTLYMLKITAVQVTGKAQYPLNGPEDIPMPPLED